MTIANRKLVQKLDGCIERIREALDCGAVDSYAMAEQIIAMRQRLTTVEMAIVKLDELDEYEGRVAFALGAVCDCIKTAPDGWRKDQCLAAIKRVDEVIKDGPVSKVFVMFQKEFAELTAKLAAARVDGNA